MKTQLSGAYRAVRKVVGHPGLVLPRKTPLEAAPELDGERFVFICGLHRSGTSILHRLLREHPDTSGFSNTRVPEDEGQFLQTVYEKDTAYGGPGQFAFNDEAHLTERSSLCTEQNRQTLVRQWGPYFDLSKQVLLEKSPANLIRARFFQAMFPGAKFLFIVRHPIPVGLSTHNWTRRNGVGLDQVLRHWAKAHAVFLDDLPHIENSLIIRYEDMIADPGPILREVQKFAGLTPGPLEERVGDQNAKYFSRWEEADARNQSLLSGYGKEGGPAIAQHFGYGMSAPYALDQGAWRFAGTV